MALSFHVGRERQSLVGRFVPPEKIALLLDLPAVDVMPGGIPVASSASPLATSSSYSRPKSAQGTVAGCEPWANRYEIMTIPNTQ